mgnify:FL=1
MISVDPECPALAAAFRRRNLRAHLPRGVAGRDPMFRRSGSSFDLKTIREYAPTDDPRSIDWRLLGRTDRTFVREYYEEETEGVAFLVDLSGSLSAADRDSYGSLVLSLGYLCLELGLSLSAHGFSDRPDAAGLRLRGRSGVSELASWLKSAEFRGPTDISRAVRTLRGLSSHRRLFLFSDFQDPGFDPRSVGFPSACLFHLRRGFDEVAEGWGEYEVLDPEGGRRILVPWDPATREAYRRAEDARSESLGRPRKGFRYFRLSAGDDRAPGYWKVLEYLYG